MAALASLSYPGAAAAGVASQYPLRVPLPVQRTPAAAPLQQQAATQHGIGFSTHAVMLFTLCDVSSCAVATYYAHFLYT